MQGQLIDDGGVTTIGLREFARVVGVTEGAVRKAIAAGRLTAVVKLPSGKRALIEEHALAEWAALHPSRDGEEPPPDSLVIDRAAHEARLAQYKADRAEIELAELRERMHHAEDVRAVMSDMLAAFKARSRAIPAKLAGGLAGTTEPAEIEALLSAEIDEALQELSEYNPAVFRKRRRRRKALGEEIMNEASP